MDATLPQTCPGPRDSSALWAALVAFVACAVLAVPGLHGLDAGDFVTAGATLGVPHATGFPALMPLISGSTLLPLGPVAHRVVLTSAVFGAACTYLLARLVASAITRDALPRPVERLAAAGAALGATLAVIPLALHTRTVDVYAASVATTLFALVLVAELRRRWDPRLLALLGLVTGIALDLHVSFVLVAPFVVVAGARTSRGRKAGGSALAVAFVLGACALLAHVWLVAAARGDTPHAWGETTTWRALVDHVSGREIRDGLGSRMGGSPWVVLWHLKALVTSAGLPVALLALPAAIVVLRMRDRVVALLLVAAVGLDIAYAAVINPMGIVDDQVGQLAGALIFALGAAGLGIALCRNATSRLGGAIALVPALAGALAGSLELETRWGSTQIDSTAEDVALIFLDRAPPHAGATVTSDLLTGGALYATLVLDARPDMSVVGRGFVSSRAALLRLARARRFDLLDQDEILALSVDRRTAFGEAIEGIVRNGLGQRELLWEVAGLTTDLPPTLTVRSAWPLGAVVRAGDGPPCADSGSTLCSTADGAFAADARPWAYNLNYRRWLASQHGWLAARAFGAGDTETAARHFEAAAALSPDSAAWQNSLAVVDASRGDWSGALTRSLAALDLDPTSQIAVSNGLGYARRVGDHAALDRLMRHAHRLGLPIDASN